MKGELNFGKIKEERKKKKAVGLGMVKSAFLASMRFWVESPSMCTDINTYTQINGKNSNISFINHKFFPINIRKDIQ